MHDIFVTISLAYLRRGWWKESHRRPFPLRRPMGRDKSRIVGLAALLPELVGRIAEQHRRVLKG
jgi:hypothetical protein